MRNCLGKLKQIACIGAVICIGIFMSACAKEVNVQVIDGNMTTDVTAKTNMTVADVLEEAAVTIGEKDVVTPAADEKITEDTDIIKVERYAKVSIVNGSSTVEVEMVGGTVADALKQAGIAVGENDHLNIDAASPLTDKMVIEITHKKVISVRVDGKTENKATDASTVQELLDELGIKLGKEDTVSPEVGTAIKDGDKVVISRVTYKEVKEKEEIPYDTEESYSDEYEQGYSEITIAGIPGTKEITYKVKYVDGKEDSREMVSETVTKEPVNEVITYGTYTEPEPEPEPEPEEEPDDQEGGGGGDIGVYEISRVAYPNCADGSHGYYEITYSDGSVEYEEY